FICYNWNLYSFPTRRSSDLLNKHRTLPLIVVSEHDGLVLHPDIATDLARDLTGLASVATATKTAAWGLSSELGKEWSCYNGAIRDRKSTRLNSSHVKISYAV